jgi:hypothetical protein
MVGRVDGAADKALSSRFSITKYPTFFLIEGQTVKEYSGNRSLDNLIDFATKSFKTYEVRLIEFSGTQFFIDHILPLTVF